MTDQSNGYYNSEEPNLGKEQSLIQHLIELRTRLLRCVVAVLIAFACLFYFANDIYSFVSEPLRSILPAGSTMIATEITQTFFTPFKLTVVAAIFLAIPYLLHQIWGFIAPGLYQHERKLAVPLLASSVALFYLGIAFAYYVVFPLIFNFFTNIGPEDVSVMPDIHSYLSIVLKLFFAFGIAFEIPIATVLLIWSGMSSVASLRKKRPYIIVGCFVVGMLLTPPDIFSQSLLAIPMWLLFEIGVFMGSIVAKRKQHA